MVFTGFFVVFIRPADVDERTLVSIPQEVFRNGLWSGSNWNWGIISTAFFKVFYSYNGLQVCNSLACDTVGMELKLTSIANIER